MLLIYIIYLMNSINNTSLSMITFSWLSKSILCSWFVRNNLLNVFGYDPSISLNCLIIFNSLLCLFGFNAQNVLFWYYLNYFFIQYTSSGLGLDLYAKLGPGYAFWKAGQEYLLSFCIPSYLEAEQCAHFTL